MTSAFRRLTSRRTSLFSSVTRAFAPALVAGGMLFLATPAFAQSASEKAAAEGLYDEGVQLLKERKYEQACEKLERSQSVDPGIGTLLYLGECYKKLGRTASAWATFREAASKADASGQSARARTGRKNADELEAKLSRVRFEMDEANTNIADLQVWQGENQLNRALWGSEVPVDPGELVISAKAPGYEPFEATIVVKDGPAEAIVRIPALVKLPEEVVAPVPPPAKQTGQSAAPEDLELAGVGQRRTGMIVGGIGVIGLGVGGVFGTFAILNEKKAKDLCDTTANTCPADGDGISRTNKARTYGTVSTIGFIAGGALLATGVVLYYAAPTGLQTVTQIGVEPTPGGAHFTLGGTF